MKVLVYTSVCDVLASVTNIKLIYIGLGDDLFEVLTLYCNYYFIMLCSK